MIFHKFRKSVIFLVSFVLCAGVFCENFIWTGYEGSLWHYTGNWNPRGVRYPEAQDDVTIPTGCLFYPRVSIRSVTIGALLIDESALLTVDETRSLTVIKTSTIRGSLNCSDFTCNSLVIDTNASVIAGTVRVTGASTINGTLICDNFECSGNIRGNGTIIVYKAIKNKLSYLVNINCYINMYLTNKNDANIQGPFSFLKELNISSINNSTLNISGNNTFNSLSCTSASGNSSIIFESGTTQTIQESLALQGASESDPLILRSTVVGSPFYIKFENSTVEPTLFYLDVHDSHNISDNIFIARNSDVSDVGNSRWEIARDSVISQCIMPYKYGKENGTPYMQVVLGITPKLQEKNVEKYAENIYCEDGGTMTKHYADSVNLLEMSKYDAQTTWLLCTFSDKHTEFFDIAKNSANLEVMTIFIEDSYLDGVNYMKNIFHGIAQGFNQQYKFATSLINVKYAYSMPTNETERYRIIKNFDSNQRLYGAFPKHTDIITVVCSGNEQILQNCSLVVGKSNSFRTHGTAYKNWVCNFLDGSPISWIFDYSEEKFTGTKKGDEYLFEIDLSKLSDELKEQEEILFSFVLNDVIPEAQNDAYFERNFARLKNPNDVTSLDVWSFRLSDAARHGGGVSVYNNVVNVSKGQSVTMQVDIPRSGNLSVMLMTLDGNVIQYLEKGSVAEGTKRYTWNGKTKSGKVVSRGMYFIRIVGCGLDETRKVMIVK